MNIDIQTYLIYLFVMAGPVHFAAQEAQERFLEFVPRLCALYRAQRDDCACHLLCDG